MNRRTMDSPFFEMLGVELIELRQDWCVLELEVLRVAQWVVPAMDFSDGGWWIIDDTGFPKQGSHSVGVARQKILSNLQCFKSPLVNH